MSTMIQATDKDGAAVMAACGCQAQYSASMANLVDIRSLRNNACPSCRWDSLDRRYVRTARPLTCAEYKTQQAERQTVAAVAAPAPRTAATSSSFYCRRCGGPTSIAGQLCGEC